MEQNSSSRELRRQLLSILFGAAIGFVPTGTLAVYQSQQQRAQFLLDRRISALREFSASVSGGGELMGAVSELEVSISHLEHSEPRRRKREDWNRVDSLYKLLIDRRYKWASDVNAQVVVIQALFPQSAEPLECRSKGFSLSFSKFAAAQRPPVATQDQTISYMKSNVATFKRELAETIDNTQETIRCHAARLF